MNIYANLIHNSRSGSDIGIITSTDLTTVSLYDCGIIVAYQPGFGAIVKDLIQNGILPFVR